MKILTFTTPRNSFYCCGFDVGYKRAVLPGGLALELEIDLGVGEIEGGMLLVIGGCLQVENEGDY